MMSSFSAIPWLASCACALVLCFGRSSAGALGAVDAAVFAAGQRLLYDAESGALLNEAQRGAAPELGFRLRAQVAVAVLWPTEAQPATPHEDFLLHFEVQNMQLLGRGKGAGADWEPRGSPWPSAGADGYARWRRGLVEPLLRADLPPHLLDYQRALLSLFQFQIIDGERNETDVSGECDVLYETVSPREIRKIKRHCAWAPPGEEADRAQGGEEGPSAGEVESRRLVRYTLSDELDALSAVAADEVHEVRAGGEASVKARAWASLRLRGRSAFAAAPAASLDAALAALPPAYRPHSLPLQPALAPPEELDLEAALAAGGWGDVREGEESEEDHDAGEGAGEGGDVEDARVAMQLLPALCRADTARLSALLQRPHRRQRLTALLRLYGLCATPASHAAAGALLQLREEPPAALAAAYLDAVALAPAPHAAVADDLLRLGAAAPADRVAAAALLAGAAAAQGAAGVAARERLVRSLARCADEPCRRLHVAALGNLRRADCAEALLEQAERAAAATALAAVDALARAPAAALPYLRARRLLAVALNASRPLELRAAALDLAVTRAQHLPPVLVDVAHALRLLPAHAHSHELRLLFRQRLLALASATSMPLASSARALLASLARDPQLHNWHALADAGTSSVLARDTGWRAGGWGATLDSAQAAAEGLLRRGVVRLLLARDGEGRGPSELDPAALLREMRAAPAPALAVAVWTTGLQALTGAADVDAELEEPEQPAAGIDIDVAGRRLPPLTLFTGQAELLGHVWAGTGSSPTSVLRALVPLREARAAVALQTGLAVRLSARAAAALALDAHAAVSLWSRTARAALALRLALAAEARASLVAPGAELTARAEAAAAPRLRIAADLDFYSQPQLCVRARLAEHVTSRAVELRSRLGARRWRRLRGRSERLPRAGLSLALDRRTHAACAALNAHDDD